MQRVVFNGNDQSRKDRGIVKRKENIWLAGGIGKTEKIKKSSGKKERGVSVACGSWA